MFLLHDLIVLQLGFYVIFSLRWLVTCYLCSGRRRAGEDLPPPPKTALAGPEYFGLIHPDTIAKIETLDPDQSCTTYWAGKQERFAFGQVSMPLQKSRAWYPCSLFLDPNSAGACSGDVL